MINLPEYWCTCDVIVKHDLVQFTRSGVYYCNRISTISIGGSRGACPVHAPPTGPNSFVFTYIFAEKHPCRRSMPPLMGPRPPPTGNPGSATDFLHFITGAAQSMPAVNSTVNNMRNDTYNQSFKQLDDNTKGDIHYNTQQNLTGLNQVILHRKIILSPLKKTVFNI